MSERIFINTHFVIALVNTRDRHHQEASELSEQFDGYPFLITDTVLLEIGNSLSRSHRQEAVETINYFRSAADVEVVHLTPSLFEKAFDLYRTHQDKTWGLTDCLSFVIMREANVNRALTYDQHFVQAGFQALMRGTPR